MEKEEQKAQTPKATEVSNQPKLPKVFDKFNGYKPKDGEESLYHVAMAKVHHNVMTGEYDGQTPYIQYYSSKRDFDLFIENAYNLGYTYKVLYEPNK